MTSGIYMMFYGGSIGQNWSGNMPWYVTPKGQLNGVIVGRAMMNYTTSYWIKTIIGDDQAWLLVRSFKVVTVCLTNSCRQLLRPLQTVDVKDTWKIKALGEFVPHVGARKAKSLIWRTKGQKGSWCHWHTVLLHLNASSMIFFGAKSDSLNMGISQK